jgi:hypothetical protein
MNGVLSSQYQFRTFDYLYSFKVRDPENIKVKIYDLSRTFLAEKTFSFADVQMPKTTILSQVNALQILQLLITKDPTLKKFDPNLPKTVPTESPAPQIPSSSPPVSPSPSSPSVELDPSLLATLQQFSQKSQAILEAAELREKSAIQTVISHPDALHNMITTHQEEGQALEEFLAIQQKEKSYKYYLTFYQKLTGVCLASFTIKCGMVENAHQDNSSYIGEALNCAGKVIPVVGSGLQIIAGIIKFKNIKANHLAVAHLMQFFADLDHSLRMIKTIARILTREQEREIHALQPLGKVARATHAIKDWFTADESTNPIVIQAIEDCQRLLAAILAQELLPTISPKEIVSFILGRPLSQPDPAPTPRPVLVASSAPSQDTASKDEMQRLKDEIAALKAQQQASEARERETQRRLREAHTIATTASMRAAVAADALGLDISGEGALVQMTAQDYSDPATQRGAFARLVMREIRFMKDELHQTMTSTAILQEEVTHGGQRLDRVEEKQAKKR